jgi:hypothetical protein
MLLIGKLVKARDAKIVKIRLHTGSEIVPDQG